MNARQFVVRQGGVVLAGLLVHRGGKQLVEAAGCLGLLGPDRLQNATDQRRIDVFHGQIPDHRAGVGS
jgi:hypothetical protein